VAGWRGSGGGQGLPVWKTFRIRPQAQYHEVRGRDGIPHLYLHKVP